MAGKAPEDPVISLEDNLKKALTELLVLYLLSGREYYIGELTDALRANSGGVLNVVFPYAAVYRMLEEETIEEVKKRVAPDGRRRQYYQITEKGRARLALLLDAYRRFTGGVDAILTKGGAADDLRSEGLQEKTAAEPALPAQNATGADAELREGAAALPGGERKPRHGALDGGLRPARADGENHAGGHLLPGAAPV